MRLRLMIIGLLFVALVASACSGDDGESSTTSAAAGGTVTSLAGAGGDGGSSGGADADDDATGDTTTTIAPLGDPQIPTFTIVSREPGDDGDTVVVLLDTASYTSLTDIDLQNVISEVVDDYPPPIYVAHVIDSPDVAELVVAPPEELDAVEQGLLNIHHLVTLEEGFRIVFVGPFEESGTVILGS